MTSSAKSGSAARPVVLSQSEIGAILDAIGFPSGLDSASVAQGSQSLVTRGLLVTEEGETVPSERLRTALGPVMLPEQMLALLRPGSSADESPGLYFAKGEAAVLLKALEPERLSFEAGPRKELPKLVAQALAKQVEGTAVEGPETQALVHSLRDLMEWDEALTPRVLDVALLRWTTKKGLERSAIVLLHDGGFTWVEMGDKARLAYVETEEELSRLVAGLVDVGVK